MSDKLKTNLIKYGSCLLFTAVLGVLYLSGKDFGNLPLQQQIRYLADVFSAAGTLLLMSGALVWATNQGAVDGIGYALSITIRSLSPGARAKKDERYADYVERKRANRAKGYGFLLIGGGAILAIGLILTAVFYLV